MSGRARALLAAAVVAGSAAVAYGAILANEFAWDDGYLVLENPAIRDLSGVPRLFTEPWAGEVAYALGQEQNRPYWRPAALASMSLDWAVAGPDPVVFHLTNLAIHALAAVLLFLWMRGLVSVVRRPSSADLWAAGIAMVWAVHPVHSEAVAIVSYRTTLLSGAAVFGAMAAMTGRATVARVVAGTAAFAIGLLSKETTIVMPALLLVQDLFLPAADDGRPATRPGNRALAVYLPLAAVTAAWLWARSGVVGGGVFSYFDGLSAGQAALMVPRVFFLYVRLCVLPWPLCPFYDWSILGVPRSLAEPDVVAGILLLTGLLAAAICLRRRAPMAAFGAAAFLVALLPVSHLAPFFDAAGDRFLYVPLAGFLLAVAGLAALAPASRALSRAGAVAVVAVVLACAGLSVARSTEWRDSETILRATVRDFPQSVSANLGLGRLLLDKDRAVEAEVPLHEVTSLAPSLGVGHGLLAVAQARAGDLTAARQTLMLAPLPEQGLPSAAEVARGEFLKRHEFPILYRMGL